MFGRGELGGDSDIGDGFAKHGIGHGFIECISERRKAGPVVSCHQRFSAGRCSQASHRGTRSGRCRQCAEAQANLLGQAAEIAIIGAGFREGLNHFHGDPGVDAVHAFQQGMHAQVLKTRISHHMQHQTAQHFAVQGFLHHFDAVAQEGADRLRQRVNGGIDGDLQILKCFNIPGCGNFAGGEELAVMNGFQDGEACRDKPVVFKAVVELAG
jgi:hypothetical protein